MVGAGGQKSSADLEFGNSVAIIAHPPQRHRRRAAADRRDGRPQAGALSDHRERARLLQRGSARRARAGRHLRCPGRRGEDRGQSRQEGGGDDQQPAFAAPQPRTRGRRGRDHRSGTHFVSGRGGDAGQSRESAGAARRGGQAERKRGSKARMEEAAERRPETAPENRARP